MGPAKRFGARYGRRIKEKLAAIEKVQRADHKCPYCHYLKVKRVSAGIWHCKNCEAKFTGKAYTISKKRASKAFEEESSEVSEEDDEDLEEVAEGNEEASASVIENVVPEINKEISDNEIPEVDEEAPASEVEKTGTEEA